MMPSVRTSLIVAALAALSGAHATAAVVIEPLPAPSVAADVPVVPWVAAGTTSVRDGRPLFALGSEGDPFSARGFLATTNEALLLHLEVRDETHVPRSGDLMWQGDFVRVAVDGLGDGSAGAATDTTGPFGADDATFGLALTPEGPLGMVFGAGAADLRGQKLTPDELTVSRDEADKRTTYDLRLPWRRLRVGPGATPTFGLAVRIKDVDRAGGPEAYLGFGDGASDLRAGLFKRLAFASPPSAHVAMAATNEIVWGAHTPAEIVVAVSSPKAVELRAAAGAERGRLSVPPSPGLRRFRVRWVPGPRAGDDVRLTVAATGGAQLSIAPALPDRMLASLYTRLDELAANASHPLFLRHLRSVRALCETERARLEAYRDNPARVRETVQQIRSVLDGFRGEAASWPAYLDGRRSLLFAYVSRRDQTLQSYYVTLPKAFDPAPTAKAAPLPLFVELHGAGNPHPLVWVSSQLGADTRAMDLLGYETPKSYASILRAGYHLQPFGRGNSGYRDIGETDVWEAIADAERTFPIDGDRRYLYGFSMGGAGTWALGSRTPDRWAAIAIYGASPNPSPSLGLARNLTNTPVWHWNGDEDDFAAAGARALHDELARWGVPLVWSSTAKLGHVYLPAKQKEGVEWLLGHRRKVPDRFSFVADTDEHRGAWGVTLERDLSASGAPKLTCTVTGRGTPTATVRVDTEGTPGLELRLGEGGLGLTGDVTVLWNGKQVHKGPAGVLKLGARSSTTAAPRRASR